MKTFTIDEIRTAFNIDESPETCTQLAEIFRDHMTQDDTADLMLVIGRKIDEQAAKYPAEKAAIESWTPYDRYLWFVREAYVAGQLMGYHIMCETMRTTLDALESAEE